MRKLLDVIGPEDKIHFIGVGGVSMSALAEILLSKGITVSGSDINYGENVKKLEKKGLKFFNGHFGGNVENAAAVVYTVAVREDNPEIIAAREKGIPLIQRSQLLGEVMDKYKFSIAVAGTHGKTTVTSMLSYIYERNDFDPTILVGADLDIIGGNLKIGKSDYFIAEACEYHRSFLDFSPYCAAILNVEPDHLDYYKDADDYHSAFAEFLDKIPPEGFAVINGTDAELKKLAGNAKCRIFTCGMGEGFDFEIKNISAAKTGMCYELYFEGKMICGAQLSVFGMHNVINSAQALAVAVLLGTEPQKAADAVAEFKGAGRRLEYKGELNGAAVYDDYAHHPTEIAATLEAAASIEHERLLCVFQPHTYSRTKSFFEEFAGAFAEADEVIFADIYAAREPDDGSVNSQMLTERAKEKGVNALYIGSFDEIAEYLNVNAKQGDILLVMGAGDIIKLTGKIIGG